MMLTNHETFKKSLLELVGPQAMKALEVLSGTGGLRDIECAAGVFAEAFGDKNKFSGLLGADSPERRKNEKKLLAGFQNNLNLLIEKTWVEKIDEELKQQVLYRLKLFCSRVSEYRYADSYNDFMEIIRDTVYLLFGPQAQKDDFPEYAIRIDPEFGLFWQYVQALSAKNLCLKEKKAYEECRLMLLLGMTFLANY
jgi:hypothetical protein